MPINHYKSRIGLKIFYLLAAIPSLLIGGSLFCLLVYLKLKGFHSSTPSTDLRAFLVFLGCSFFFISIGLFVLLKGLKRTSAVETLPEGLKIIQNGKTKTILWKNIKSHKAEGITVYFALFFPVTNMKIELIDTNNDKIKITDLTHMEELYKHIQDKVPKA